MNNELPHTQACTYARKHADTHMHAHTNTHAHTIQKHLYAMVH